MHTFEEISIGYDILGANRKLAQKNRETLDKFGITAFNIMGAIGSGKTLLVETTIQRLVNSFRIGAIAGDVVARLDASRFEKLGIPTAALNTGKECHLDAHLVEHGLLKLPLETLDILFIENVGNLICPTDYELGEHKRVVIVSVSEGDDIVEKHPLIFGTADLIIVNKIDIADAVNADADKMVKDARIINPRIDVLKMSLKTGEGIDEWIDFVKKSINIKLSQI
ncbi:MAG: hydrogenase nickel incorporation protein HypB [Euryarchaeota archaeon]|nr:hydrogenase nickel incorporation protein HypB [Euryarchaeota archaeon]MBU4340274.1 hydrogenase nickel incorporation protein HypB [Euryarchaeota archaeon]MBU4454780.1 hydrogenase nickel incorporation protein HypB [Euryarchaeota archaeon]MCG2738333.1 hydrogenase nickel incorporation protein HypB [Candidatus Methanoperedenaceae archaeon]